MIIKAVKLRIVTAQGEFGFLVPFSRNLTIIRGKNSSGKSTLFNSLLYGLGMEELIGGKGEKVLPYALKDWFDYQGQKIPVVASEVYLEIENQRSDVVTFRRTISDKDRSSKLVEISDGAYLTENASFVVKKSTYLHDPGAAQQEEGFHRFLETFIGLALPTVPTTSGGETKLYFQTVFAALAVEQKRGWSDYIASIPFYGIRDARTRVVEFLLDLSIFESNALRNRLDAESIEIANGWNAALRELQRVITESGSIVYGIPAKVSAIFDSSLVRFLKRDGSEEVELAEYTQKLRSEYAGLEERAVHFQNITSDEVRAELDKAMEDLQRFTHLYESVANMQTLHKASLHDYQRLLLEAKEDLARNKAAAKLRDLGAKNLLETAADRCPTCHHSVEDSLLDGISAGPQMDLATNINYLERQCGMLDTQIAGIHHEIFQGQASLNDLATRMAAKRELLNAIRADVSTGASQSRANVKRQMQIDDEVNKLERAEGDLVKLIKELEGYAQKLASNQTSRKQLPRSNYSDKDESKIALFEKFFRANAGAFGYESAEISDIKINRNALTPFLSDIELRQYNNNRTGADIRADSSASDFVRLIWSYLLGLYQTSSHPSCEGNHPALLLFDEPGQHSMADTSQHSFLQKLGSEKGLQSIVAASFDESESVFREATKGVEFKLIEWDGKSIQPL